MFVVGVLDCDGTVLLVLNDGTLQSCRDDGTAQVLNQRLTTTDERVIATRQMFTHPSPVPWLAVLLCEHSGTQSGQRFTLARVDFANGLHEVERLATFEAQCNLEPAHGPPAIISSALDVFLCLASGGVLMGSARQGGWGLEVRFPECGQVRGLACCADSMLLDTEHGWRWLHTKAEQESSRVDAIKAFNLGSSTKGLNISCVSCLSSNRISLGSVEGVIYVFDGKSSTPLCNAQSERVTQVCGITWGKEIAVVAAVYETGRCLIMTTSGNVLCTHTGVDSCWLGCADLSEELILARKSEANSVQLTISRFEPAVLLGGAGVEAMQSVASTLDATVSAGVDTVGSEVQSHAKRRKMITLAAAELCSPGLASGTLGIKDNTEAWCVLVHGSHEAHVNSRPKTPGPPVEVNGVVRYGSLSSTGMRLEVPVKCGPLSVGPMWLATALSTTQTQPTQCSGNLLYLDAHACGTLHATIPFTTELVSATIIYTTSTGDTQSLPLPAFPLHQPNASPSKLRPMHSTLRLMLVVSQDRAGGFCFRQTLPAIRTALGLCDHKVGDKVMMNAVDSQGPVTQATLECSEHGALFFAKLKSGTNTDSVISVLRSCMPSFVEVYGGAIDHAELDHLHKLTCQLRAEASNVLPAIKTTMSDWMVAYL